jgi:hypothetical protein
MPASQWIFIIVLTVICLIGTWSIVGVVLEIERRRQ